MDLLAIAKAERAKLDRVIYLLEELPKTEMLSSPKKSAKKGHQWTEAERKAMSLKQKARWAKQESGAEPDKAKRPISAASRRKMAAAQRARWAKVKSQKKKTA